MKTTFLPIFFLLISFYPSYSSAQKNKSSRIVTPKCATMQVLDKMVKEDPTLPEQWRKEGERRQQILKEKKTSIQDESPLENEIIIPVVFHLVGNAALVNSIPDRDIYEQIEILNEDYGGKKAEKYKGLFPAQFNSLIGKIPVKFVLARKTPGGALTSGIERRITNQTFNSNSLSILKSTASGGLDAWDVNSYLNIWCASFTDGLLGIATFPFMTPANEQGVAVDLFTIGSNPCRTYYPNYSEGATLSHEIGHYFYLGHAWGDDNGSCSGSDFWIQTGWPLPLDATDDTPNQGGSNDMNFGNISGVFSDVCSPVDPGIMYMNYMNYYDDRSLFMFTPNQGKRIMGTLNMYRTGLKTSDKHLPPYNINDAYLVNFSPFGKCDSRIPVVNNVPLKATLRNAGSSSLQSLIFHISIDGNTPTSINWSGNLASGAEQIVDLGNLNVNTEGAHSITIYTTSPNGNTDDFLTNDTLTSLVNVRFANTTLPFSESFSSSTFPPSGWSINNPGSSVTDTTWRYHATAGFTGAGSATLQNYNYNASGEVDELIMPPIDFGSATSASLKFKVAHAAYSNSPVDWDGLEVYVSSNGGQTYTLAYKKVSNELKSVEGISGSFIFNPLLDKNKWREETISLSPYIISGEKMIIKFRNVNAWGNNIYLDDISIMPIISIDASITAIENFSNFYCNANSIAPYVRITNNANIPLTSATINYKLDNGNILTQNWTGNLAFSQSQLVMLNVINNVSKDAHTFTAYISSPNGSSDIDNSNDTLKGSFFNFPEVNAPLIEDFEKPAFTPNGWAINNPDKDITWTKSSVSYQENGLGTSSALFKNHNNNNINKRDELFSPVIKYSNVDSVFLKFDVAATFANTTGQTDTLEILLTTNCGETYQSIYKKWGNDLKTFSTTGNSEFIPTSNNQWRRDSINLLPFLGTSSSFQVIFRSHHNAGGNNIYLDNINVFTENVPQLLKQRGMLIMPTGFTSHFKIWHYQQPSDLKYINIYNSVGQLVWQKNFSNNADKEITINLANKSAGTYIVTMGYEDPANNISQRIVKY